MLSGMEVREPGWIKALDGFLSNVLGQHAAIAAITISVLCWLAATTVIWERFNRVCVIIAVILGAAFWVAEDFGAIFTGQGTDPNSGLLLIVLAAVFWPSAPAITRSRELHQRDSPGFPAREDLRAYVGSVHHCLVGSRSAFIATDRGESPLSRIRRSRSWDGVSQ